MFGNKEERRRWKLFNNLLLKYNKSPINIIEEDVFLIYKRAALIMETYKNLDYIYSNTGSLEDSVIKDIIKD